MKIWDDLMKWMGAWARPFRLVLLTVLLLSPVWIRIPAGVIFALLAVNALANLKAGKAE